MRQIRDYFVDIKKIFLIYHLSLLIFVLKAEEIQNFFFSKYDLLEDKRLDNQCYAQVCVWFLWRPK